MDQHLARMMKTQSGFTLTELLVVMTIVGMLVGLGVPSFKYVTSSSRVSSEVNALLADMQYARSEAVREGQTVTVCASTDGATCSGGGGNAWHGGWIVFSDANNDQTVQAGTEPVLRTKGKFTGTDTFTSTVNAVTFNREGFASGLPNAGLLVTLHDQASNAAYTRCLQISFVGKMQAGNTKQITGCT